MKRVIFGIVIILFLSFGNIKYSKQNNNTPTNQDAGEKSRTVDGKNYTVSDLFANKDFRNYKNPDNDYDKILKDTLKNTSFYPDTVSQYSKAIQYDIMINGNKSEIIKKIVKEQYNNSRFKFLKDSGLVKLKGNKIDKSELVYYRPKDGAWSAAHQGYYSNIWLRAADSDFLLYIQFREDGAKLLSGYPKID